MSTEIEIERQGVMARERVPKRSNGKPRGASAKNSDSDLDTLLWRLKARTESENDVGVVFGLTSCCRKTGVSTIAANLAVKASENHMGPVLLIDANLVAPKQHRIFRQSGNVGLVDVLVGGVSPSEAIQPTSTDDLDLMPLGAPETLSQARIALENYNEAMRWIREHYSTVFIDLPQIDDMKHALMLARKTDVTIIAIRSEAVSRKHAVEAIDRFAEDGVNIGGTILTRRKLYTPSWFRSDR